MSDQKKLTGWMERPLWERTALAILIVAVVLILLVLLTRNR